MLREFLMNEPHPLALVQRAVFEFLREQTDYAIFGAQAVNAYVTETRSTEDVDVASLHAKELAYKIARFLNQRFYMRARVRSVRGGIGYRVFEIRKSGNRHHVDVRPVKLLPPYQMVEGLQVVAPAESIANKVAALHARGHRDKALTDARDLRKMLRTFPELQAPDGEVHNRLVVNGAPPEALALWREWAQRPLEPEDDDDEFDY